MTSPTEKQEAPAEPQETSDGVGAFFIPLLVALYVGVTVAWLNYYFGKRNVVPVEVVDPRNKPPVYNPIVPFNTAVEKFTVVTDENLHFINTSINLTNKVQKSKNFWINFENVPETIFSLP